MGGMCGNALGRMTGPETYLRQPREVAGTEKVTRRAEMKLV